MTSSEDYLGLITPEPSNFGYRQGLVISWSPTTAANQIRVGDGIFTNLPIITQTDLIRISPGDRVAIIKYNNSYAVLGKIKTTTSATPWIPVPLYPQFNSILGAGAGGYWSVNVGTLVTWEGRINATHHRSIEVDGIWGQASGSNTVTYQLQLGGNVVGSWTTTSFEVARKGPFDISSYVDQEFLKIEVKITSSVGSGTVAHQILGCFLR